MSVRNLEYFFTPRSVAVVGASSRPGSVGATVLTNLASGVFPGEFWPVNPKYLRLGGMEAYRDVAGLPSCPELAIICTSAATVPDIVGRLVARDCKAVVVLSTGLDACGLDERSLSQAA